MSDETNGNGRQQIEEDFAEIRKNLRELTALALRNEFNLAQQRTANDERLRAQEALSASTSKHLDYLTQLAGVFADRTIELEDKA